MKIMNHLRKKVFIFTSLVLFLTPAYSWQSYIYEYKGSGYEAANFFNSLNPTDEFNKMKNTNTIGFVTVYGYTIYAPGIDNEDPLLCLRDSRVGSYIIRGTSDTPKNAADAKFNEAAVRFARKINKIILEYIKTNRLCEK